jgi:hypothetical protein
MSGGIPKVSTSLPIAGNSNPVAPIKKTQAEINDELYQQSKMMLDGINKGKKF